MRALLEAGLVDYFRVGVFPVITGSSGRDRIYDGYPDLALDLVASRTFDGRIQLLRVRADRAGPPGTPTADASPAPSVTPGYDATMPRSHSVWTQHAVDAGSAGSGARLPPG